MDGVAQLCEAALANPYTRQNMPPASSSTPGMSSLGRAEDSWRPSSSAPPAKATPAKIRFTYSVHRQDRYSVSKPPSSRPTAPPARRSRRRCRTPCCALCGSVKVVVSSDSAEGTRIAANAPWQARAVISMVKLTEAPPMAETPAKPASPVRNVTFRPSRSDSLPPSSSKLPNDRE